MAITFDPGKRAKALAEQGRDFAGPKHTFQDLRADYGEVRLITVGPLSGRMMIVGWTPGDADRRVFSMRKANARERTRFVPLLA